MTHQTGAKGATRCGRPLSVTDIVETRTGMTHHMHWPVDRETTARLRKVIRLDVNSPVPWWRRLIRRLGG